MSSTDISHAEKSKFEQFFRASGGIDHDLGKETSQELRNGLDRHLNLQNGDSSSNSLPIDKSGESETRLTYNLKSKQTGKIQNGASSIEVTAHDVQSAVFDKEIDNSEPDATVNTVDVETTESSVEDSEKYKETTDPIKLPPAAEAPTPSLKTGFFGQTSEIKNLYGVGSEVFRWSEYMSAKAEELALTEKARDYAIVVRYTFPDKPEAGDAWQIATIEVQSPRLREFLLRILKGHPDGNPEAEVLKFLPPFHSLLHRWSKLSEGKSNLGKATQKEVELLISALGPTMQMNREITEKVESSGLVEWRSLGFVFDVGDLVVRKGAENEQLFKVSSTYQDDDNPEIPRIEPPLFHVNVQQVDWDGRRFGFWYTQVHIPKYAGFMAVKNLPVMPLRYLNNAEKLEKQFLERGKKFESLSGYGFKQYSGKKYIQDWTRPNPNGTPREIPLPVNGRVIVDAFAYHRFEYNGGVRSFLADFPSEDGKTDPTIDDAAKKSSDERPSRKDIKALTDEQCMLATPRVKGFDLKDNLWCEFDVHHISLIDFMEDAFSALKIGKTEKGLLQGFVQHHLVSKSNAVDVVPGKGKGIIVLLCGPPGVGKTLTAESVAEDSKKPLYSLRASDVGTEVGLAELKLSAALEHCKLWNAVFLIDEADVFLQRRSSKALDQNKLAAIFLRQLEYYDGILFMTTNRYAEIDVAFKSRIDLVLPYKDLDELTRRSLWTTFANDNPDEGSAMSEADLDSLSHHELNGREIRNIVKTAKLLAKSMNQTLQLKHLTELLNMRERIRDLN